MDQDPTRSVKRRAIRTSLASEAGQGPVHSQFLRSRTSDRRNRRNRSSSSTATNPTKSSRSLHLEPTKRTIIRIKVINAYQFTLRQLTFPGAKYLRHRRINTDNDELHFAEEGRVSETPVKSPPAPLSRSRIIAIAVLVVAIILTLSLSVWGISRTGKSRMGCTKAIILGATIGVFMFTAGVMVAARRVLMEVLLMALLEVFIGSVLLVEIRELM